MIRMLPFLFLLPLLAPAQDAPSLVKRLRAKMDVVNDYRAQGMLKTDVSFLRIPVSRVNVLYRKPDRFRIRKDNGISLLPKGGISINLNAMMALGEVTAVDAGQSLQQGRALRVVKMLPASEASDVILSTLYIDEKELLIRKAVTTTRENGTYEMEMEYGRHAGYGLPDKVVVSFDTRDYKMPKAITFEYEPGEKPSKRAAGKDRKGRVEIRYEQYVINQGIPESAFR
ncbi:MAG: hypothetical protein FJX89_04525 [Bacteroidetes bacterium]|nr:hypothetical protein [Bacteroidota bacterium]